MKTALTTGVGGQDGEYLAELLLHGAHGGADAEGGFEAIKAVAELEIAPEMLQQQAPEDYVSATGEHHAERGVVTVAAAEIGNQVRGQGAGIQDKGRSAGDDPGQAKASGSHAFWLPRSSASGYHAPA